MVKNIIGKRTKLHLQLHKTTDTTLNLMKFYNYDKQIPIVGCASVLDHMPAYFRAPTEISKVNNVSNKLNTVASRGL